MGEQKTNIAGTRWSPGCCESFCGEVEMSMAEKWRACFEDSVEGTFKDHLDRDQVVRVCLKCDSLVLMAGPEPGMDHVRLHDVIHQGTF